MKKWDRHIFHVFPYFYLLKMIKTPLVSGHIYPPMDGRDRNYDVILFEDFS